MGPINTEIGGIILCLILFFALPSFLIVSFLIKRNDVLTDLNSELRKQNGLLREYEVILDDQIKDLFIKEDNLV